MKRSFLPLLLFVLIVQTAWAQITPDNLRLSAIKAISQYRNALLLRDKSAIDQLRDMENRWNGFDTDGEIVYDLLFNTYYLAGIYGYSDASVMRILQKDMPDLMAEAAYFTEQDVSVIYQHVELLELILEGLLHAEYPYVIDGQSLFFSELGFYQFERGQRIGEIGAGAGTFSMILAMMDLDLELSINELSKGYLMHIEQKISALPELVAAERIQLVLGKKKSIELEAGRYDKIIIRNSFHHFTAPIDMLASIRKALVPSGQLYLYEPVRYAADDSAGQCELVLEREALLHILSANGFQLLREEELEGWLLLAFAKRE